MLEPEEITKQRAELAQQRKLLESQLAEGASEQAIAATRRAIAECKATLRSNGIEIDDDPLDQPPETGHQQTIGGNAQIGVAVGGHSTGTIHYQSGGARYEAGSIHTGDYVAGNKTVHIPLQKRDPIDLAEALALLAKLPEDKIPIVGDLPAGSLHKLPPSKNFVGREDDLISLAKQLKQGELSVISTAMGGMGKSTLASEFIYRYGRYFAGGVYWLSFADPSAIESEIAACGGYDAMQVFHESEELSLHERCKRVRSAWNEPIPRLLVFDNWDQTQSISELDAYLPKAGGCRVLITSRNSQWPVKQRKLAILPLGLLSRPESIALLQHYIAISQHDANAIAEELGDLPLALTLAGRFLDRYQSNPLGKPQNYLVHLRNKLFHHRSMLTQVGQSEQNSPLNRQELGLQASFELSYERLQATDELDRFAIAALARASYFAPNEPIPQLLLEQSLGEIDPEDEEQALLRADAIKRLLELGLLEPFDQQTVKIHQLIARYAQAAIQDQQAQAQFENSLVAETHKLVNQQQPAALRALMPHLRYAYQARRGREELASAELALALGRAEQAQINYGKAEPLLREALAIRQKQVGAEHPDTATSLHNLAGLYYAQGRYGEAEPLYLQALAIWQKQLGAEHPGTAASLNNLAGLYYAQGRYGEAEPHYREALAIRQKQLGAEHPDTAQSLNNLALLYESQGRYGEAEPLLREALAIWQKQLGAEHPDTAASLYNLANLYYAQGRYGEAEPLYLQALAIWQKQLGAEHPTTAASLNNLAELYDSQGRYGEAEPLLREALAIRQKQLGAEHPDTAASLYNLAYLYLQQSRYQEAEAGFQQALSIWQRVLGPEHPSTKAAHNGLALCQQLASQLTQAEAAVAEALADPAIDRAALAQKLEEQAEWAESVKRAGSPWLALAAQLRKLAAKLIDSIDSEEQALLNEKLQRAQAQVEAALQGNDPEISAALYEKLIVVADAYAAGAHVLPIHAEFASALRKLAAQLQSELLG
jgi:tetratricopeptide (TPR) repeat protein